MSFGLTFNSALKMKVNEPAPIHYVQDVHDFLIVENRSIQRESIQDKIVIAGDFGPGDDSFIAQFPDG